MAIAARGPAPAGGQRPADAPREVTTLPVSAREALGVRTVSAAAQGDAEIRPRSDDELHDWIVENLGKHIPRAAVCDDHAAPFDFMADVFLGRVTDALILGNRAGGKTEDLAILHVANARWKPGHETSHFGAIKIQAKRCYTYYRRAIMRPTLSRFVPNPRVESSVWTNGSTIEILPGTEIQTQGGHPDLTAFDELEQAKRQPYENAKAMSEEYVDPETGERQVGQFLAASTRVSGLGLMQAALDEAAEKGTPVYSWCILETMQPCDGRDGRPGCVGRDCPIAYWCIGGEADDRGDVEETLHSCDDDETLGLHGRVVHADGWRSYGQALAVFRRAGADTWVAQHLSRRPETKALIYSQFSKSNVTPIAEYVPGAGPLMLAYDWGFTDKTWIGIVQERDGDRPDGTRGLAWYVVAELTGSQTSERDWVRAVIRAVIALPDYDGPSFEDWAAVWDGRKPWPTKWPSVWPDFAAGDPSAVQLRRELSDHGIGTRGPRRVKHEVTSGQSVLRAIILSGGGRRLFVAPACTELIRGLGSLRAKEIEDGSFSEKPDPDAANHRWSHAPDGMRYLSWSERRRFGIEGDTSGAPEGPDEDA